MKMTAPPTFLDRSVPLVLARIMKSRLRPIQAAISLAVTGLLRSRSETFGSNDVFNFIVLVRLPIRFVARMCQKSGDGLGNEKAHRGFAVGFRHPRMTGCKPQLRGLLVAPLPGESQLEKARKARR
jgi:hypothetical protein